MTAPQTVLTSSSIRAPRRRDAEANRASLISAAQTLLAIDPHASLDAIAQAAGLSRRALYGHFADREKLLTAVIAAGAVRFNVIAEQADDADPRVAIASMAVRLWREASAVRASANIALDDLHLADTAEALAPLRVRVRQIVAAGTDQGLFRTDMEPELLSFLVEETARATVREMRVGTVDSASVVARIVLSVVGLSWREQESLLAQNPHVLAPL